MSFWDFFSKKDKKETNPAGASSGVFTPLSSEDESDSSSDASSGADGGGAN